MATQGASKKFALTDIVSISDFSKQDIEFILQKAAQMEKMGRSKKEKILRGKVVASLFFEPSTRTRLSFETAIQNLGGKVVGFAEPQVSSIAKGESLTDTIKTIDRYTDIIVMRHSVDGTARRAAEIAKAPVINGGDGNNQHPTQTLMDLYTIKKEFGRLDGIKIGFLGDIKHQRPLRSLAIALSRFKNNTIYCISPEALRMPDYITEEISKTVKVKETEKVEKFLPQLDFLYVTRIRKERFSDPLEYERLKNTYRLDKSILKKTKKTFKILHCLPRLSELAPEVDETKEAIYFDQVANGVPVREAILSILVKTKKKVSS